MEEPTLGSVSVLLRRLRAGEDAALAQLHRRCWPLVVRMARRRLGGLVLAAADEEDIAQEAFWGFFRSVRDGRVPRLDSRHDLFALLTHIVACRAATRIEHELGVAKRARGRTLGQGRATHADSGSTDDGGLQRIASGEPTPQQQAALAELYGYFVEGLPERLRDVATLHLGGATSREIADRQGCVERTIFRKLALIRQRWQSMAAALCADG